MTDQRTLDVYNKQVDEYQNLIKRQSTDPVLLKFIERIKPDGLVLDLGCGPAMASRAMRDKGLRVDPVDASSEMVRLANENFQIGARQATFDDIDAVDYYDGIWANFSLLHASHEQFVRVLDALSIAIKAGGVFHLGMKLGTGSKRDKIGRFYSYYSEEELRMQLSDAGFDVENTRTGEARGLAGDVEPWIMLSCHYR